jgi:hypothetical protein
LNTEPLRLSATPERLALLRERAGLPAEAWEAGTLLLVAPTPPGSWRALLDRGSLLVGWGLVLSGVIYGVAWNWGALGYLTRLAGVEVVMALAGAVALWRGPATPAGAAASAACLLLTGALLAQLGISYQTGADAWELFAAWTLLGLPFAAATRSGGQWAAWVLLPDLTLGLALEQRDLVDSGDLPAGGALGVLALHGALLSAWMIARQLDAPEGRSKAPARTVGLLALFVLSLAVLEPAWDFEVDSALEAGAALAWLGLIVGALIGVARGADPLFAVGAALAWLVVSSLPLTHGLFELVDEPILSVGFIGLVVLGQAVALTSWIRRYLRHGEGG